MSFASFRANNDVNALKEKFNKLNGKGGSNFNDLDDTYWTPKHVAGPDGKGEVILRFLPAPPDGNGGQEPDDIVKYFKYSVQRQGKWYINRGRNSLGVNEPDPANDYNRTIWSDKTLTKDQKKAKVIDRSEFFIAGIRVIKDPNRPENEGKVFRWEFGKQIYNMINAQLFPEFETDSPVNVFDPIEGADFHLRVTPKQIPDKQTGELRTVSTYEKSYFAKPSAHCSLEDFDPIWEKQYSLQSEIAQAKFKPYEQLVTEFNRVMGLVTDDNDVAGETRNQQSNKTTKSKFETAKSKVVEDERSMSEVLDDDIPWDTGDSKASNVDDLFASKDDQSSDASGGASNTEVDDWFSKLGQ